MELRENMEFNITSKFIPNFCKAKTLKILNVNEYTIRIEMEEGRGKGVFPKDQFGALIRNGALIFKEEELKNKGVTA